jgi:hypothetical protein
MVPSVIEVGRVHVSPGAQPTEARLLAPLVAGGSLARGAASGANAEPVDGDGLGGCAAGSLWEMSHPGSGGLDKVRGEATHVERVGSLGTKRVTESKKSRNSPSPSPERLASRPSLASLAARS